MREAPDPREGRFLGFGPFTVDTKRGVLLKGGAPVALSPKAFETLLRLLSEPGRVVTKSELMDAVWPDAVVEENNLTQSVSALRKALGDDGSAYVATIAKRGYRFVVPVEEIAAPDPYLATLPTAAKGGVKRLQWLAASLAAVGVAVAVFTIAGRTRRASSALRSTKTLAVLPFKSLNPGPHDAVLELGMADVLITRLSGLREVTVRPISTVRRYAGTDEDPIAAGRALKVDSVLEGTIHRSEDRLRFTARLLDVVNGRSTWAGEFDEEPADLFAIEDSIASRMAEALAPGSGASGSRLARSPSRDPAAFREYLKGRYFWNKRSQEGIATAIGHFRRALDIDPNDALAWTGLGDCYLTQYDWQFETAETSVPEAKAALARALDLDPLLSEAHASRAYLSFLFDRDDRASESEFETALRLQPNNATTHEWRGRLLVSQGRFDDALAEMKRAIELDPLSPIVATNLGATLYYARRYDLARETLNRVLEASPGFLLAHWHLADLYERTGSRDAALREYLAAMRSSGDSEAADQLEARIHGLGYEESMGILLAYWDGHETRPIPLASRHAAVGDEGKALALLERAVRERNPWIVFMRVNPQLDGLRGDPRFAALLERAGKGPE